MLYPLSYWSLLIDAPPSRGVPDSRIITAATFRLKRGAANEHRTEAYTTEAHGAPNIWDSDNLHNMG